MSFDKPIFNGLMHTGSRFRGVVSHGENPDVCPQ